MSKRKIYKKKGNVIKDLTRKILRFLNQAPDKSFNYKKIASKLELTDVNVNNKSLNEETTIQRFCKRRRNSTFSQPNIERLKRLFENNLIHNSIKNEVLKIIQQEFIFPKDIITQLKSEKTVWQNYQDFSEPYKRIRIAYIDSARKRPDEFDKRLKNFIEKTKNNKQIKGFGGIDKYY